MPRGAVRPPATRVQEIGTRQDERGDGVEEFKEFKGFKEFEEFARSGDPGEHILYR
jgi:hypothetical protein